MIKRICVCFLLILICMGTISVVAQTNVDKFEAAGGYVTIEANVNAAEGTPVLVLIVSQVLDDNGTDITDTLLPTTINDLLLALRSREDVLSGNSVGLYIEYADTVLLGANGELNHNCQMKSSLPTGKVNGYISYLGSNGWESLGEFDHVSQNDVDELVAVFNGNQNGYATGISADLCDKDILQKSGANTAYYEKLLTLAATPEGTDYTGAFCDILAGKRPVGGFDILSLVSKFNESCAWVELRENADTHSVLEDYNSVFWDLPLNDDSFLRLPQEEKNNILSIMKSANFTGAIDTNGKMDLEKSFEEEVVLANFRQLNTRENLASFVDESATYSAYFINFRNIITTNGEDAYMVAEIYNYILLSNHECKSFTDIEDLVKSCVQQTVQDRFEQSSGGNMLGSGSGGGGSSSGGSAVRVPNIIESKPIVNIIPFSDVAEGHWAHSYIARLFNDKVINGVSDTEFAPNASIQRQDFVKILIGVLGIEQSLSNSTFNDLVMGCYYEPYIMAAVNNNLIYGVGGGKFGMGQNITRQDAAVILCRALEKYNISANKNSIIFADESQIATYAKDGLAKVSALGIFSGDNQGNFNPKNDLSRSEACAILCRLADIIKGE